jgi:hypothetical protein
MWRRWVSWIARCSGDWRLIVGVLLCQMLLLIAMLQIGKPFERATGYPPFDFQNQLTVADIARQLPHYNATARQLYYGMSVIDFAFPALGGLFWALLLGAALRLGWPDFWRRANNGWWLLLPFAGTLSDWSENIAILGLLAHFPPLDQTFAQGVVLAKRAKLTTVTLTGAVSMTLFALGLLRWRLGHRQGAKS